MRSSEAAPIFCPRASMGRGSHLPPCVACVFGPLCVCKTQKNCTLKEVFAIFGLSLKLRLPKTYGESASACRQDLSSCGLFVICSLFFCYQWADRSRGPRTVLSGDSIGCHQQIPDRHFHAWKSPRVLFSLFIFLKRNRALTFCSFAGGRCSTYRHLFDVHWWNGGLRFRVSQSSFFVLNMFLRNLRFSTFQFSRCCIRNIIPIVESFMRRRLDEKENTKFSSRWNYDTLWKNRSRRYLHPVVNFDENLLNFTNNCAKIMENHKHLERCKVIFWMSLYLQRSAMI